MKYCKKCVQPDTRPGIVFDDEGVCPACRFAEKTDEIDWEKRGEELEEVIKFCKENSNSGYDCIIGVSGGKDSTRQALYVRDELGLNPLLVSCSYPPEQVTEIGTYNLSNLISLGFDTICVQPAPEVWKKMMLEGFIKFGNWCKSTEMALYASAPKIAIAYHIPLIFLGENPAIQIGDLGVKSINGDANRMKYTNTLAGGNPEPVMPHDITNKDVFWYRYPSDEEMEWGKLRVQYLGYYWKDFTKLDNALFSLAHGLKPRNDTPNHTGFYFNFQALDDDFMIVNQMMKHLKYGFGQVTDEVCEEIRFGRMNREEGIKLVKKYDGKCAPYYIKKVCEYLEISEERFWEIAESYRNKDIWVKNKTGKWVLKEPLE